jgi:hypothetical protein
MKKLFALIFILLLPAYGSAQPDSSAAQKTTIVKKIDSRKLYRQMKLEKKISFPAFDQAITGYNKLNPKNKNIITLIDFSRPSTQKRLFVLDIKNKKILKSTVVSHGRNSGENYATSFSNQNGSFKSSLGFYITETTYQGKNGYSLVLNGLEQGINDHAKERAIVIHGASYANPSMIETAGRLGRSLGCPALPPTVSKEVIDTIKDGSLLYIYANNADYLQHSKVLPQRRGNA